MATVHYSHRKYLDLLILCRPNLRITTYINQQQTIHPLNSPISRERIKLYKSVSFESKIITDDLIKATILILYSIKLLSL
jgi:hypothetical protein